MTSKCFCARKERHYARAYHPKNDADQRLDRFLGKAVPCCPPRWRRSTSASSASRSTEPALSATTACARATGSSFTSTTRFFEAPSEENVYLTIVKPKGCIIYEDENILLLDKPAGMVVHADEGEKVNTLVNHLLAYLYQKREWKPREEKPLPPRCATASTATRAASSSRQERRRRCAS